MERVIIEQRHHLHFRESHRWYRHRGRLDHLHRTAVDRLDILTVFGNIGLTACGVKLWTIPDSVYNNKTICRIAGGSGLGLLNPVAVEALKVVLANDTTSDTTIDMLSPLTKNTVYHPTLRFAVITIPTRLSRPDKNARMVVDGRSAENE